MQSSAFELEVGDGVALHVYRFEPDAGDARAVVCIAHGMCEHAGRYARFAEALTAAGYAVYAADQRGHGKTARSPGDLGYFADVGGWRRIVDDLYAVTRRARADHPKGCLLLFGHSMGSILLETYLFSHGDGVDGAVLSGPTGDGAIMGRGGLALCAIERLRLGPRGRSRVLKAATVDGFNRPFRPHRTAFDYLSRDEAEVDAYVADPLCGFDFTAQGWADILTGVVMNDTLDNVRRVPPELPVYVFAGSDDSVGGEKGVSRVVGGYRRAGLTDITERIYEGGRHESLNDIHREQVTRDVIDWLDAVVARRG